MQQFVLERDDPSLAAMAKMTGYSRQALHKALRGPDLPSQSLVKTVVGALFQSREEEESEADASQRKQAIRRALDALGAAVADKTARERGIAPGSTLQNEPSAASEGRSRGERGPAFERFTNELRRTHELAGRPTLDSITRELLMTNNRVAPSRSTLSDWLTGRTIPRDWPTLHVLLEALQRMSGGERRLPRDTKARLEQMWQMAWDERQSQRRGP
ncbi:hypothetical protein [Streptomyces sp. CAI-85]|uniref:hypothetical protein n=1 Tax=Streptomyces sp. CAI-85 TaxID=1472662 RepID=UPI001587CE45|nr:hypothetical protein [Streptomyces sp. CAI-85]NUV60868.1 hypothetical protein [Streptomyces sp. CAI-85]